MEAKWIDWPYDDCPECGSSVQILTDTPQEPMPEGLDETVPPPYVCCGDKWRCEDGHEGGVYCDSETPVQLDVPCFPE